MGTMPRIEMVQRAEDAGGAAADTVVWGASLLR